MSEHVSSSTLSTSYSVSKVSDPVVFLIDDDQPVLDSLTQLVSAAGFRPQPFGSAEEFLDNFNPLSSGCVVTDLKLSGMGGQDLQQRLIEMGCLLPLIVVTGHATVPVAVKIMENGALTLLQKPYKPTEMLSAIKRAFDCPINSNVVAPQFSDLEQRLKLLTDEEQQVLQLLLNGHTNKSVSSELNLSLRTVDRRRRAILDKTGIESVPELAHRVGVLQSTRR